MTPDQARLFFFWVTTAVLVDRAFALFLVRIQIGKAVQGATQRNKSFKFLVRVFTEFEIICMAQLLLFLGALFFTFSVWEDAAVTGIGAVIIGLVAFVLSIWGSLLLILAESLT